MDIPEWLYEKTDQAGTWYDVEFGKGFSPDYNKEQFIAYHRKAVEAMGEHWGQDGLISYIELGDLGHWGEWHVNYSCRNSEASTGKCEGTVCVALGGCLS